MELGHYWWVILPLAAFTIPLAGICFSSINTWLHYRQRREALELIRTYAEQGKEPPPEVLAALGRMFPSYGAAGFDPGAYGPAQAAAFGIAGEARAAAMAAREAARAERYAWRAQRHLWRSPIRRWNQAIFLGALAAGLYGASLYSHEADTVGRFQIGAIILSALAVAALLSALLSTLLRPK